MAFFHRIDSSWRKVGKFCFNSDGYVELPIQPIAWKGGAGTLGHVSFVYKSPQDN